MNESDIEVPAEIKIPNRVYFSSNKTFQNHFKEQTCFQSCSEQEQQLKRSRNWSSAYYINESCNREIITTLFASQASMECPEKLLELNINYRDLASLNDKDLELINYKYEHQRDDLLNFFAQLPNQDPGFENICKLPEAQKYNDQILINASDHLDLLRSGMALSNYKLKLLPPEDVIVGEKNFASRFVLAALNELKSITDEIDDELHELNELVTDLRIDGRHRNQSKANEDGIDKDEHKYLVLTYWIIFSSLVTGACAALWFWKLNKYFK